MRINLTILTVFLSIASFSYGKDGQTTKEIIREMLDLISGHFAWDDFDQWTAVMSEYFTEDMVYDTNYYDGTNEFMGNGTGIPRYQNMFQLCIRSGLIKSR